jgi:hypothetical protein
VANAKVTATNNATQVSKTAVTSSAGTYTNSPSISYTRRDRSWKQDVIRLLPVIDRKQIGMRRLVCQRIRMIAVDA